MPLNNGPEALSDNLAIMPIGETEVDSTLALIMRNRGAGVVVGGKKCFADAQMIFLAKRRKFNWRPNAAA